MKKFSKKGKLISSGMMTILMLFSLVIGAYGQEITAEGATLTEKLQWLQRSADSHNIYIVEVNANENIEPHTFYYQGAINITVILRGGDKNPIIRLRSHGTMFTIRENVTFILENNITLMGHNGNSAAIVNVNGGTFIMNDGATITGNNHRSNGGGVYVGRGTFEMNGGSITGNNITSRGGGVYLYNGTFTMTGGTISGNNASHGGGVWVDGGETFNMRGGTITGNTASENGGGVYISNSYSTTFNKNGGTITGYNSDQNDGNAVRDGAGNVLARRGHAAFVSSDRRKETTAGPTVNLSNNTANGWDN